MSSVSHAAACVVQRTWRRYAALTRSKQLRQARDAEIAREIYRVRDVNVRPIQLLWRAKQLKLRLRAERDRERAGEEAQQSYEAASAVQQGWRYYRQRRTTQQGRLVLHSTVLRDDASSTIQALWRGFKGRKVAGMRASQRCAEDMRATAATQIWAWYTVRNLCRQRRASNLRVYQCESCVLVQKHYKRHSSGHARIHRLRKRQAEWTSVRELEAAECMQRAVRCSHARASVKTKKTHARATRQRVQRAARTLQKVGRAMQGRLAAKCGVESRRDRAARLLQTLAYQKVLGKAHDVPQCVEERTLLAAYRALERRYLVEDEAATTMTLSVKSFLARRRVQDVRCSRGGACMVIQRRVRQFLACRRSHYLRVLSAAEALVADKTEARLFIAHHAMQNRKAAAIQCCVRGYLARQQVSRARCTQTNAGAHARSIREDDAATLIQSFVRGRATRTALRSAELRAIQTLVVQRFCLARASGAAVRQRIVWNHFSRHVPVLQRAFRSCSARMIAEWRRGEVEEAQILQRARIAATLIQRNYRRHLVMKTVWSTRTSAKQCAFAAVCIQACIRRFLARRRAAKKMFVRQAEWEQLQIASAALEVTRMARGALSRMRIRKKKRLVVNSSLVIQRAFRGYLARKEGSARKAAHEADTLLRRREHAALELQAFCRLCAAKLQREALALEKARKQREEQHRAKLLDKVTSLLQAAGRAGPVRRRLHSQYTRCRTAAVAIQRMARGVLVRGQVGPLREQRRREKACVAIQRAFRREREHLLHKLEIRTMELRIARINILELCRSEGLLRSEREGHALRLMSDMAAAFRPKIEAYKLKLSRHEASVGTEQGIELLLMFLEGCSDEARQAMPTFAARIQRAWRLRSASALIHSLRRKKSQQVKDEESAEAALRDESRQAPSFNAISSFMPHRAPKSSDLLYFTVDRECKEDKARDKVKRRRRKLQQDGMAGKDFATDSTNIIDWRQTAEAQRKRNPSLVSLLYEEEAARGEVCLYYHCGIDDLQRAFFSAALKSCPDSAQLPRGRKLAALPPQARPHPAGDPASSTYDLMHSAPFPAGAPPLPAARGVSSNLVSACVGGRAGIMDVVQVPGQVAPRRKHLVLAPLQFSPDVPQAGAARENDIGLVVRVDTRGQLESLIRQVTMDDPMVKRLVLRSVPGLTDSDLSPLMQALRYNTSVVSLDLSHNVLSDATAEQLSDLLVANTAISTIDLSYTHVTGTGATHLAAAIHTNPSLVQLSLLRTLVPRQMLGAIGERLRAKGAFRTQLSATEMCAAAGMRKEPLYTRGGIAATTISHGVR